MSRKKTKRTIIEEELPEGGEVPEFGEVDEGALPSNIDQVIDALEDQVEKVTIYRRLPGSKQAYLTIVPIDEFAAEGIQEYVARYYGGGRYLARLQDSTGKFIKGYTFWIDETVRPEAKAPAGAAVPGSPTGNAVTDGLLAKVLEKAVTGNGGGDMASMMQAIATIAAGQASAMMTAMTPLLAKITELASGGGQGGNLKDLVAAIELGSSLGGDKDEGYIPVIREVGVPLVRALEQYMASLKGGAPSPVRSINPAVAKLPPTPGAPAAPAPVAAAPAGPPWVAVLAPHIPRLVDFAVHGGDPGMVAGIVYNTNPPLARWLEDAVEAAEFPAVLLQHFPALAPHAEWVDALLDEFREDEAVATPEGETAAEDGE